MSPCFLFILALRFLLFIAIYIMQINCIFLNIYTHTNIEQRNCQLELHRSQSQNYVQIWNDARWLCVVWGRVAVVDYSIPVSCTECCAGGCVTPRLFCSEAGSILHLFSDLLYFTVKLLSFRFLVLIQGYLLNSVLLLQPRTATCFVDTTTTRTSLLVQ